METVSINGTVPMNGSTWRTGNAFLPDNHPGETRDRGPVAEASSQLGAQEEKDRDLAIRLQDEEDRRRDSPPG
jgi:hypothetical protein